MKKIVLVGLAIVCLGLALVGSRPQQAAVASGECRIGYGPNVVPVGLRPVEVRFEVPAAAHEGCNRFEQDWNVRLTRWDVDVTTRFPSAMIDPDYLPNSDTRPVSGEVRFSSPTDGRQLSQTVFPYSFKLVHLTTWGSTFKAKRVDSSRVRVSGTLARADWEKNVFAPHAARKVDVVFTTSRVTTVATPKLDAKGHFDVIVTAKGLGSLNVVYTGNSTSSPATTRGIVVR